MPQDNTTKPLTKSEDLSKRLLEANQKATTEFAQKGGYDKAVLQSGKGTGFSAGASDINKATQPKTTAERLNQAAIDGTIEFEKKGGYKFGNQGGVKNSALVAGTGHGFSADASDIDKFLTCGATIYGELGYDPRRDNLKVYKEYYKTHQSEITWRRINSGFTDSTVIYIPLLIIGLLFFIQATVRNYIISKRVKN